MIKLLFGTLLLGFVAAAGAQTHTQPPVSVHYGWAEVLNVDPVFATVLQSGKQCPPQTAARKDQDTAAGAASDASEHQATASQAPAGGGGQTGCDPEGDQALPGQIVAYDVEYRYRGEVYLSRLPYDPGERLRVKITIAPAD